MVLLQACIRPPCEADILDECVKIRQGLLTLIPNVPYCRSPRISVHPEPLFRLRVFLLKHRLPQDSGGLNRFLPQDEPEYFLLLRNLS